MFMDMNMCRDLEYYVDPLSKEVVELGTKKYPYKDLETVFTEVLYLHSNKPREVTVYIKEKTFNYMSAGKSYVVNLKKLAITSYSMSEEKTERSIIVGVDSNDKKPAYVMNTMRKAIMSDSLLISEKLLEYGGLTSNQILSIQGRSSILTAVKTNIKFDQIDFLTDYTMENIMNLYMNLIHSKQTWLELINSSVDIYGMFIGSNEQSNFALENIYLELYRTYTFLQSLANCTNPNKSYESEIRVTNLTMAISKPEVFIVTYKQVFYVESGNVFLNGIKATDNHTPMTPYIYFHYKFYES